VALIARGDRARHLADNGVTITGLEDFTQAVEIVIDPATLTKADVLILSVKTQDTAAALASVRHMDVGSALSVQNGIKKNAQLAEVFGEDAVLGAISVIAAAIEANGAANYVMENHTLVGEPRGGTSARAEDIVGRLVNAKLVASVPENILSEEWTKYVLWLGVATMALMPHQATWKFLSDPGTARVMARVAREAALLSTHLGIPLQPEGPLNMKDMVAVNEDGAVALVQQTGNMIGENSPSYRPSILQDVQRGKSIEVEETFGHAVSLAREYGLAVPTLETCYHMLAAVNRLPHLVG
jgi:2-dehydropantoate 2-reductase